MRNTKKLSDDDLGILFLLAGLMFGAWFRIYPPLTTGFPINDGALFYRMIETVQENNFHLPVYVVFNQLQIPFAYPPLAFYLAGAIGSWFHIPTIKMVLWMPAVVLIITLPCLFWLTKHLLHSTLQAGVATFLYALLPRALTWMIMGGGVTRSLGNLFLILATLQIYLLFTTRQVKFIFGSIIFSSAVCLTHPEATLHTIIIALILWGFYGRDKAGLQNALAVGAGTLILTSPWWVTILVRFGIQPLLAASQTGFYTSFSWLYLFRGSSDEPYMTIIGVLALIGLFTQIAKRQYFLPFWYIIPFLVEPRNAPNVYILPMAILAAISLTELILPGIAKLEISLPRAYTGKLFIAFLFLALLIGMFAYELELNEVHLSSESREAFQWVKNNTSKDSEFLIITGNTGLFSDYVNEWFPLLAERHSTTTIQGYEWINEIDFSEKRSTLDSMQQCTRDEKPLDCIEALAQKSNIQFDYVLVQKDREFTGAATSELLFSKDYRSIFTSKSVVIFKHLQ